MFAASHAETRTARRFNTAERSETCAPAAPAPERTLASGEVLFQAGDTRARLYRVERGALCHYRRWDDGRREIIEFAFPGDIIGLGHMEAHISTAQAMVETVVSTVTAEEFERALGGDDYLAARLSAATDREFDFLRERAVESGKGKPLERLASFLTVLSHMSADEGRDPLIVADEISSGLVAERLDMTIDVLARALRELERRGMVRSTDKGLRIADIGGLEELARIG
jgi:CRP/FNR family transcriptional regulator, anaerobic regulatory protein